MIADNLHYTLDCLKLATIYSRPPMQASAFADPTPVCFTLANGKPLESLNSVTNSLEQVPMPSSPSPSYITDMTNEASSSKDKPKRCEISFETVGVSNNTGKSQFSTRCDVVYKKLLRDFRRKLMTEFNSETNFVKNKRFKDDNYIFECLVEFVTISIPKIYKVPLSSLGMDSLPEIEKAAITLGSLLYPKDMVKLAHSDRVRANFPDDSERLSYTTKFHEALYSFSMQRITEFLKNRYICFFLYLFIGTIHSRKNVQEIMSIFEKSYSKALGILSNRCKEVLAIGA